MAKSHSPGPKKILLNGIEVGEYIATGDAETDAQAAQQVLKAKGLWKPITKLQSMYNQANAFCFAASVLYEQHLSRSPFQGQAVAPFVVNAAFSAELFIKMLQAIGGTPSRSHKLLDLHDELPTPTLDALKVAAARVENEYDIEHPAHFTDCLAQLNNAFERWRYLYESSDAETIQVQETIFVLRALHEVASAELKKTL
jgi:hypothetical protein